MAKSTHTYIYQYEIGGAVYVGSTRQTYQSRWNKHLSEMTMGTHHSALVQQAFESIRDSEGANGVHFELLEDMGEDIDETTRLRRERYYIQLIRPTLNEAYLRKVGPDTYTKRGQKVDAMAWELQQMQNSF
jgi:hypothetical protein